MSATGILPHLLDTFTKNMKILFLLHLCIIIFLGFYIARDGLYVYINIREKDWRSAFINLSISILLIWGGYYLLIK